MLAAFFLLRKCCISGLIGAKPAQVGIPIAIFGAGAAVVYFRKAFKVSGATKLDGGAGEQMFYLKDGEPVSVTKEVLSATLKDKQLTGNDQIRFGGDTQWRKIFSMPGLFRV